MLAAGVALGAAELLAAVFGPGSSPIVAVGGAAIDASPEWLKSFAIRTFGTNDKVALLVGIGVVLDRRGRGAGRGVGAAAAPRRRRIVVFGAIGAAAAVTRPANGLADAIPSIAGAAVGLRRVRWLRGGRRAAGGVASALRARVGARADDPGYDRRRFLLTGAAAAGIAAASRGIGQLPHPSRRRRASRAAARSPRRPTPRRRLRPARTCASPA